MIVEVSRYVEMKRCWVGSQRDLETELQKAGKSAHWTTLLK
jgi:hypothetical protein